jgi:hypothetical protein
MATAKTGTGTWNVPGITHHPVTEEVDKTTAPDPPTAVTGTEAGDQEVAADEIDLPEILAATMTEIETDEMPGQGLHRLQTARPIHPFYRLAPAPTNFPIPQLAADAVHHHTTLPGMILP